MVDKMLRKSEELLLAAKMLSADQSSELLDMVQQLNDELEAYLDATEA